MACELPIVATAASGIPDLLEREGADGGMVVPVDDAARLAQGLGRVLDDPALARELGHRARQRVEEYCSFDAVARCLNGFMRARGMRSAGRT
jgi:glycosyltransferase involved in cell wall biosynthesis